ncbi:MAG: geranylgeranylglyceryl/heptaprenylglyceryl phosphate synthase [Bacteroidales bacterium]|nr:geranylgeranylglyceryl/heptaprenylglyceryl phosphate synthase [Bacteroidales bacterium]MCF8402293.1 geranylgeranylglyceryl/heptaprenylglyceryl phosphate synthase [Bacteroidales bacterium]
MGLYSSLASDKKQFAVLVDPDKYSSSQLIDLIGLSVESCVNYFFVGGSLLSDGNLENTIKVIKDHSDIPVIIFPGDELQINSHADGILLLSLISGRNPELLIGKHVIAAPYLRRSGLEILPTGYILVDSGKSTTALYMSNSLPIPANKNEIAVCTAMAGEMLGMKLIYMDGGSGADDPVPTSMIQKVKENISIPLILGGGIRTPETAREKFKAGADIIVVGNAIETDHSLLTKIAEVAYSF